MKNILKEAIADTKAVRTMALENAKATLSEAFAPQIQSLVSDQIREEMDDEMNEDEFEGSMAEAIEEYMDDEDEEDEFDFEIPNDPRAKKAAMKDIESEVVNDEEEMEDEDSLDEYGDEHPISTQSALEDEDDDEEIDLDELIHEIESTEDETLDEAKEKNDKKDEKKPAKKAEDEEDEEMEDMTKEDLIDLIKSVVAEMGGAEAPAEEAEDVEMEAAEELEEVKAELFEVKKANRILTTSLNEVNLINAKLLYVNKIFKKFNLDETKKTKVVNKLDEANTAKEAKFIYESLNEIFSSKKVVKNMNESMSFASKASGQVGKGIVVDPMIARLQKLANIKTSK
jgi:hypothetical protein